MSGNLSLNRIKIRIEVFQGVFEHSYVFVYGSNNINY